MFASSRPELFFLSLFFWRAGSLHCALFRLQWSLFVLLIPQFVTGKAKQIDTVERGGGQNKHAAYESVRLMPAGEKTETKL